MNMTSIPRAVLLLLVPTLASAQKQTKEGVRHLRQSTVDCLHKISGMQSGKNTCFVWIKPQFD